MRAFVFVLLGFILSSAEAQYKVSGCKSPGLDGEICIVKKFRDSDKFNTTDLLALKDYIASHPALPWLQVLDPKKKLLGELQSATGKIRKSDRAQYNQLLSQLKIRMDAEFAVEALALLAASQPNYSLHLNSHDRLLMRRFVNVLSTASHDQTEISDFNYRHCSPNIKKFNAIMKERERCSNLEDSKNSFNLYHTLAELAACEAYAVANIEVQESKLTEQADEAAPCVVRVNNISASVGRGNVEIMSGGKVIRLDWSAGHDLSGVKNDIRYWRDQLEPQFIKAVNKSQVAGQNQSPPED